jgi:hypothetical protein
MGKDAHWAERRPDLSALNDLGRSEFERSVAAELPEELKGELRAQIEDWRDGLKSVWTAAAALGKPLKHETIKPIISELDTAVRIERGRVPTAGLVPRATTLDCGAGVGPGLDASRA